MNISGRLCLANLSSHMKLRPFVINRTAFSSCGQSESTKLACHHRIRSHCQLLHRRLVQHCRSLHIVKLCELSTTYIVLELCADSIYVLDTYFLTNKLCPPIKGKILHVKTLTLSMFP